MVKHVLFDNDGTIVDSEHLAAQLMLEMLRPFGFSMTSEEYCQRFPGYLTVQILEIVERDFGISLPGNFVEDYWQRERQAYYESLRAIPGMTSIFRNLKVPKSMVSNGSKRHVESCLRKVKLLSALDGQIFSGQEVARPKPFPDVYRHAVEVLSLDYQEVIAVEDSPAGVRSAKAAGLRCIGFLGASHVSSGHREQLESAGADFMAEDSKALRLILLDFRAI